jgi:hypothetical protein
MKKQLLLALYVRSDLAAYMPLDYRGRHELAVEEHMEKFAESIVKECVTVLNNRFMGDMNREDMEVRRCVRDIKKHFGVEE